MKRLIVLKVILFISLGIAVMVSLLLIKASLPIAAAVAVGMLIPVAANIICVLYNRCPNCHAPLSCWRWVPYSCCPYCGEPFEKER